MFKKRLFIILNKINYQKLLDSYTFKRNHTIKFVNKCHIYATRRQWFLTRKFLQCSKLLKMIGFLMAGAERLELPTPGFGDRCSTNWTTPLLVWINYNMNNWRNGRDSNPRPPAWQAGILTSWTTTPLKMTIGSALLSHGETPHYHQRYNISLLSSVWYQVDLLHYLCQKFFIFLIYSMNKLKK